MCGFFWRGLESCCVVVVCLLWCLFCFSCFFVCCGVSVFVCVCYFWIVLVGFVPSLQKRKKKSSIFLYHRLFPRNKQICENPLTPTPPIQRPTTTQDPPKWFEKRKRTKPKKREKTNKRALSPVPKPSPTSPNSSPAAKST